MDVFLSHEFLSALLRGSVIAAIPLLLAGLGEQFSQKAGVLNIGIEGVMLAGAFVGFLVALNTGSLWAGFLAGAAAGALIGLVMAIFCVRLGLNQIIVGIAITLTATGITSLLHYFQFSKTYPRLPATDLLAIPGLSSLPVLGAGFFNHHPMVYLALLATLVFSFIYAKSFLGLNLTAAGEKPEALDAAGVNVGRTRTVALLVGGAMSGLGGAFLSEIGSGVFVPHMVHGAGFMSIVLAMLGRGRPTWVLIGALIFGTCLSATTALQVAGVNVSTDIIQMLPFLAIMLVLIVLGKRSRLPAALGVPYQRGAR
ncbi:putative B6 ABC transporter permease subunit 1 [Devosia sp. A369]